VRGRAHRLLAHAHLVLPHRKEFDVPQGKEYHLETPKGVRIAGLFERLTGTALISIGGQKKKKGKFQVEYAGSTDVHWDGQKTATNRTGERLFVDVEGTLWPESKLVCVEDK
jgi:hypothetical protein